MQHFVRRPFDLPQREHTPYEIYKNRKLHRRQFLETLGMGIAGASVAPLLSGCQRASEDEIRKATAVEPIPTASAAKYPAQRNEQFEYGRAETIRRDAAEYTNFYEFSSGKDSWRYVEKFKPSPWTIEIGGLCSKPQTLDMDDIYKISPLEERAYRHRCVETWAMCVPWTGFSLAGLLKQAEPSAKATAVLFETFDRPEEAPGMVSRSYPWPYTESLTIEEAMNDLAIVATGIYGEPLPKQHGAPLRLVVPWKYGFKCIKSIAKITFIDEPPRTFWNTLAPNEYGIEANVNPDQPHPRWSQKTEWMLGTKKRFETKPYNGYGDWVAKLYT